MGIGAILVDLFLGIYLAVFIPYMIYFNHMHFYCKFKCRKKHYHRDFNPCFESNCKFARFCYNYKDPWFLC